MPTPAPPQTHPQNIKVYPGTKNEKKWVAYIKKNKIQQFLDSFDDEIEAAKAYDEAAKKYHGEFANLNFPEK